MGASSLIHTEKDYPREVNSLRKEYHQLSFNIQNATGENVVDWTASNVEFFESLALKVPKVDKKNSDKLINFLILKHLDFENLKTALLTDFCDIYEILINCISNRENNLLSRFLESSEETLPQKVIQNEIKKLREDITTEIKTLKGPDLEKITYGVIADWLIRCPLDFENEL